MTDIAPDDGCRSRRCRQVGRCNCLHVNDDGTAIPGDGTAANPYRHPTPPITCILDSNGSQLSPNASKCITLPASASSVELADGRVLNPNINGIVVIPDSYLTGFSILDSDGTTLSVTDSAVVSFEMDGGIQQGYVRSNINYPTIIGSTVVFPGEKGLYADQGDVNSAANGTPFSVNTGAPARVEVMGPQTLGPLQKNTHLRVSIGLGLADLDTSVIPANANEQIRYQVVVLIDDVPSSGVDEIMAGSGYWTPDNSRGYIHDTYVIDVNTEAVTLGKTNPIAISVVVDRVNETLQPERRVYAECQLAVQWV